MQENRFGAQNKGGLPVARGELPGHAKALHAIHHHAGRGDLRAGQLRILLWPGFTEIFQRLVVFLAVVRCRHFIPRDGDGFRYVLAICAAFFDYGKGAILLRLEDERRRVAEAKRDEMGL